MKPQHSFDFWIASALLGGAACISSARASDVFPDPAPPKVIELEAVPAPEARAYPELTIHSEPRSLAAAAVVEDWAAFRGPRGDGRSAESPLDFDWPEDGPPLLWEMSRGEGFASPVIRGNRLVFTHRVGNESIVDCLDATTGKRYWRQRFPCVYSDRYIDNRGPRSTPVIAGDHVYVHGVEGRLFCFELATGRVVWQRHVSEEFGIGDQFFGVVSSPLVFGELLIQNIGAPAPDGPSVVGFDRHTGRIAWGTGDEWGPGCSSPVVAAPFGSDGARKLFVLTGGQSRPPTGGLMVMDPVTGALDFTYPYRSRTYESVNGASPVPADGRVFLSAAYGVGSACLSLKPDGGFDELWKNRHVGLEFSTPVYANGALWLVDGVSGRAGALLRMDTGTGEESSRTDLEWQDVIVDGGEEKTIHASVGAGSLLWADEHFLVLGDTGQLVALAPKGDGAEVVSRATLFRASQAWTPPVVSGGLLYVCQNTRARFGASGARLLCYDLRGRL